MLELLLSGDDVKSAALLTPYNGQVRELQRRFSGNSQLAAWENMVDVSSVDGYQVTLHACIHPPTSSCLLSYLPSFLSRYLLPSPPLPSL